MFSATEAHAKVFEVRSAGQTMLQPGSAIDGLLQARAALVDHPATEFMPHVDTRTLAVLYVARKTLADIFVNLGTDSTLDVEYVEQELKSLAAVMGSFLDAAFNGEAIDVLWERFEVVIRTYSDGLLSIQDRYLVSEEGR